MYKISGEKTDKLEPLTFSDLNMKEDDMEELLRKNIEMICDEEEAMLVVGQQVKNEKHARSDLTAVDDEGNIVLIEIKRDRKDIENRREAFEFQSIRYAASYATIQDYEDLVNKVYAPYIEKYRHEFGDNELTSTEIATRKIVEFLEGNEAFNNFNKKQKIILVASDFDEQTLSAVAWLNKNGVDMSCYKLIPYQLQEEVYINIEKLLPLDTNDNYYVNLMDKKWPVKKSSSQAVRRNLPKIDKMLEWGAVQEGDVLTPKGREGYKATLLGNGHVEVDGRELSIAKWLKAIYEWSSVQTYAFTVHKETGKTLKEIRKTYMDKVAETE